jgi:exosortase
MADREFVATVEDNSFRIGSNGALWSTARSAMRNHLHFLSCVAVSIALFWSSLATWANLSIHDDRYSHLILIPAASVLLVYSEKREIFAEVRKAGRAVGIIFFLAALGSYVAGRWIALSSIDHASIMVTSLVLMWMGAFVVCYGTRAFRTAAFALLFLFLMIPLPSFLLDRIVLALQHGSAVATYLIFELLRVPAYRNGLVFSLPGFRIEIATQCSGIRSSTALLITALLATHFFLRTYWKKAFLIAFIVPLVVLKNALRIATLSVLSLYVNRGFLTGKLHHYGGIPFSIVSVGILLPFFWYLQRSENRIVNETTKP